MKEYVQKPGVRPWHGDELVNLQKEGMDAVVNFLQPFGPFVLNGFVGSGSGPYAYTAGVVFLQHPTDGWKVARVNAVSGATDGYGIIYLDKATTQKLYDDGNNHDAVYDYTGVYLDHSDGTYATVLAGLTTDQYVFVFAFAASLYPVRNDFDLGLKKKIMPAWHTQANALQNTTQLQAATVQTKVVPALGMVFIRGSVTVKQSAAFGASPNWLRVKLLDLFSGYLPADEEFFVGTQKYTNTNHYVETSNRDYIHQLGFSVKSDGYLYVGAINPATVGAQYTVNFNAFYFF